MENTYNLEPRFDNRKSFYGKAIVEITDNAGESKLYSYNTHVATFKAGIEKSDDVLVINGYYSCLLYTSPSPRDRQKSRMPSSA